MQFGLRHVPDYHAEYSDVWNPEQFGLTRIAFEVNYGKLPHDRVMTPPRLLAERVMPRFAGDRNS